MSFGGSESCHPAGLHDGFSEQTPTPNLVTLLPVLRQLFWLQQNLTRLSLGSCLRRSGECGVGELWPLSLASACIRLYQDGHEDPWRRWDQSWKHFIEPWLGLDELEIGGTTLSQPCLAEPHQNYSCSFVGSVLFLVFGLWVHHQRLKQRLNPFQRGHS